MLILINLDTAQLRRERMTRQLAAAGLSFERLGVDFRTQDGGHVRRRVAELFPRLAFDFRALSGAEVGCWVSHLSAWQRMLEAGRQTVTVLEDDLTLAPEFAATIGQLEGSRHFDVVYLGTSSRNISARRSVRIGPLRVHAPVGIIFNTWAYVIARPWVERFFAQDGVVIDLPIDHVLGGRVRAIRPLTGVVQPPVVGEDAEVGADSQIEPYSLRLDRHPLVARARRRLLASRLTGLYYRMYRWL